MPLNVLFAFVIAFILAGLAFGPLWGLGFAVVVSIVVLYWDKISNWVDKQLTKWGVDL